MSEEQLPNKDQLKILWDNNKNTYANDDLIDIIEEYDEPMKSWALIEFYERRMIIGKEMEQMMIDSITKTWNLVKHRLTNEKLWEIGKTSTELLSNLALEEILQRRI